jgi:hypothetical protein
MNNEDDNFYMLVVGSRDYSNYQKMSQILDFLLKNQKKKGRKIIVVSGGAKGADSLAERYADEKGFQKHIMPAQWDVYGKSAGYRRNREMHIFIANPNCKHRGVIAFWNMKSKGTRHNFQLAEEFNSPLRVFDTVSHRFLTDEQVKKLK